MSHQVVSESKTTHSSSISRYIGINVGSLTIKKVAKDSLNTSVDNTK